MLMDILSLAFYLSILSYCLGALLRAIPLPFFHLKRLGRTLMVDGVFAAILVFSYQTLIRLIDYLSYVLGVNWATFTEWVTGRSSILFLLLAAFKAIGIVIGKTGLGTIISSILSPIVSSITTSLTTILTVFIIALVLRVAAGFLIALGVLMCSIPFRLARSAGAMIIAVTMVFSIGIPLMPHFIATVTHGAVTNIGYNVSLKEPVCSTTLNIVDAKVHPVSQAVIEGYRDGELLYRYVFNEQGQLEVDKLKGGFPCSAHEAKVEIAGIRYTLDIPGSQGTEYVNYTMQLPDLLILGPNRVVELGWGISVINYSRSSNNSSVELTMELEVAENTYFGVYIEASDKVEVFINSEIVNASDIAEFSWYGVSYIALKYPLTAGTYLVNIIVRYYSTTPLDIVIEPFIVKALNIDIFSPELAIFYVVYMFVELTILPLVYIAILLTISYGVARLLGGASTGIARYLVAI